MPNYFTDNEDLQFHFNRLKLETVTKISEEDYEQAKQYDYAPVDYEDAVENYRKTLEVVGDIAGNFIEERAEEVDLEGAHFADGKVTYAKGTRENLDRLAKADLMGMILPRKYGGLQVPFTIYVMGIEVVARADASLMNLFGLQDIADTINKFADDFIKDEFLPKFATGDYTGAMALTEPDAGSDLQAVKTHAYQDEQGQWRLRGVKRFITNGNGEGLLVLARSEQGTKDARGLSLFAAHADDSVVIRRIENKLGIHGSPTCEMQFNDTPAKLVGNRKFGLIKYVFDLMYRARMGVSAQALGVAQAAYEEALKYAKEREQFGKPIYELPAVANILIDMRVRLESMRSLFYYSAYFVDMKEKTEELIARKKANGESFVEQNIEAKKYTRMANLLTPLSKFICAEGANTVSYDSLQIHGGTGYMREFKVERLARDARITNIYEGTSQLQIVAATGPVLNDVMKEQFEEWGAKEYKGGLERLDTFLKDIREIYKSSLKFVLDKKDPTFQEVAAKDIVELYSYIVIGYLLLQEATEDQRKVFVANRYIVNALSLARKNAEAIKNEAFSDIMHADKILV